MADVAILERTKDYFVLKIPRRLLAHDGKNVASRRMSEKEALEVLSKGMVEYRRGKTKKLASLRELRHGGRN